MKGHERSCFRVMSMVQGGLYRQLFWSATAEKGLIRNSLLLIDFGIVKSKKFNLCLRLWTCTIVIMLPFNLPQHRGECTPHWTSVAVIVLFFFYGIFLLTHFYLMPCLRVWNNHFNMQMTCYWTLRCQKRVFFFLFSGWCYFTEAKEAEWEVKTTNQESSQTTGSGDRYAGLHFRQQDGQTGERSLVSLRYHCRHGGCSE